MDVYSQAAKAVQGVREKKQSLKRLCLAKDVQKKRATFAVAAETLKQLKLLDELLKRSQFFQVNPTFWPDLAYVLVHDLLFGPGLRCKATTGAPYAVHKHHRRLKQALQELLKERKVKDVADLLKKQGAPPRVPVYLRVNTLKAEVATVRAALEHSGWRFLPSGKDPSCVMETVGAKRKREPAPEAPPPPAKRKRGRKGAPEPAPEQQQSRAPQEEGTGKVFYRDPLVPSLFVFPPTAKFHLVKHPTVFRGEALIQDKASCLPAYAAVHQLPMCSAFEQVGEEKRKPTVGTAALPGAILDATAAPGNKTSLLCALAHGKQRVIAVERDEERATTLRARMKTLGAEPEVIEASFLDLDPQNFTNVQCVVLDPSCSGSGMLGRIEAPEDAAQKQVRAAELKERLERLSEFQRKMLLHAMSFPSVRRVVYSTCSVHKEENEEVVRDALLDETYKGKWALADLMPGTWPTRGLPIMQDGEFCIRCNPARDATQGFFLAVLERLPRKRAHKRGGAHRRHRTGSRRRSADAAAPAAGAAGAVEVTVQEEGGLASDSD